MRQECNKWLTRGWRSHSPFSKLSDHPLVLFINRFSQSLDKVRLIVKPIHKVLGETGQSVNGGLVFNVSLCLMCSVV